MDRKHALPSGEELATQETTRLVCLTALRILPTGYQMLMANVEEQSKVSDIGLFLFLVPASARSPIHLDLLRKGWTGCRKVGKAHLFLTLGCFHRGLLQMSRGAHASFRLTSTGHEERSRVKEVIAQQA